MKKNTFLSILMLLLYANGYSQYGCGDAVVLTNGYTQDNITSPGDGGEEDWNDNPSGTSINASYWDDDVYLFEYTAGLVDEEISITTFSRNSWNGIGIFSECTGTTFSGELAAQGTTGSNSTKTITAIVAAGTTVYIATGQWGTPNNLDFDVTNFTATPITMPPNCDASLTLPVIGTTTASLNGDLKWSAATGSPSSYILSLGTTPGGTEVVNAVDVGLVLAYNVGILLPATTYYAKITPINSNGIATGCTEYSFTTCGPNTTFFENFEGYATGSANPMPDCWDRAGNGSVYITTGSVAPNTPVNRLYMFANGTATTPTDAYAIMPNLSNLQANTHRLKFKAYCSTTNKVLEIGYLTDVSDIGTYNLIEEVNLPGTSQTTTQEFNIEPNSIPEGVTNLVLRNSALSGSTTVYVDDVVWEPIPACPDITVINTDSYNSTSVSVSWEPGDSETDWQYVYAETEITDPTTLIPVDVEDNPIATIGSLTPATSYNLWVRSNCGDGALGNWQQTPYVITTTCAPVTEFSENFEEYSTGSANPLPDCWSRLGNTGSSYITTGSVDPNSPPNRLYLSASATTPTQAIAVLPPVSNLQAGTHRLKFKAYCSTAERSIEIGYYDISGDPTTFVVLEELGLPSTAQSATQELIYIPEFVPEGVESLVFKNNAEAFTGTTTIYIDDVVWEAIPSCTDITEMEIANLTDESVDLYWNPGDSETAWQYVYAESTVTEDPSTLTPIDVIGNPITTITDLDPNTTYNYWIRSNCGSGNLGNWSTLQTFTTRCAPVTTFFENFDSSATGSANPMPDCWDRAGNASVYVTTGGTIPGSAPNRLYIFANGSTPTQAFAIMPPVSNLQANTHRLKFKAYATTMDKYVEIGFFGDVTDENTFVLLETIDLPGTSASAAQTIIYEPSNVPEGITSLVFRNPGTPSGSTTMYIDDVVWEEIPTTVPTCVSNVEATPDENCGNFANTISWDVNEGTDGYYLSIGTTTGGVEILNSEDLGSLTSYTFVGELSTTYYYTLVPYNSFGPAIDCVEQSFVTLSTGCYCISQPSSNDNSGVTNVQLGSQDFPTTDVTYFDHSATDVDLPQGVIANLQVTLATGYTYNTNVWIDLNDNYTFESDELLFQGEAPATNPTTQNASFLMPETALLGMHKMRIVTTDVLQNPANPCYNGTYGVTLDFTVNVTPAPSCLAPSGLSFDSSTLTANEVTINWNPATTVAAEGYDYYYSISNDIPDESTVASGSVAAGITTVELTDLDPVSTYFVWVRSKCSLTEMSLWSNSITFTTPCASYDTPFTESFATFVPNCWSRASAGTIETGPTNSAAGIWVEDGFLNSGTTGAARINLYSTNRTGWLITPAMNTTVGSSYNFSFNYGVTAYTGFDPIAMGSDDYVKIAISTDNGMTWTEIENFTSESDIPNTSQDFNYEFEATTTQVKFAFIGSDGPIDDLEDFNFYIDNIAFDTALTNGNFENNSFTTYPNPVKNVLNISYNQNISDVAIYNMLGQQVLLVNMNVEKGQIDMSNLTSGTYLVKVRTDNGLKTIKIIKE